MTPPGLHLPEAGLVSGQLVPFKVKAEERKSSEKQQVVGGRAWQEEPALEESQEDGGGDGGGAGALSKGPSCSNMES